MDDVAQAELFPVIAEKAPRGGLLWQYLKATAEHGTLVPAYLVSEATGLSRQRVNQLLDSGTLVSVRVHDKRFIPVVALELFMSEQRKSGVHINRRWVYLGDGEPVGESK